MTKAWAELAAQLRVDSIRCTTKAGSGHPTSSMSAADLMAVLLTKYLRFDWSRPHQPNNDRLIFSKGHACPLLYSMFKAAGAITDEELMTLREFGGRMQGHPNPRVLPLVDVATGALGQGLPIGVGMALNGQYLDKLPYRVWVLLGDSEMAEGGVWEAFDKASYYKLDRLIAILDMNRLGQRGETDLGWNGPAYAARARAFGWNAIELDGHDLDAIDRAYAEALQSTGRPTLLVAKTKKGRGASLVENKEHWHGVALKPDQAKAAIAELGGPRNITIETARPEDQSPAPSEAAKPTPAPTYETGGTQSTRQAYGDALAALGSALPDLVALDGEVSNSTKTEEFKNAHPNRFFEMFIAEQHLVAGAAGVAVMGKRVVASTFAAFLSRAYDQIRMAAVSGVTLHLVGSHAGVSIGQDGPSQMGLEDISMLRSVFGSTVLYPCDANQTVHLTRAMLDLPGITYLRTTREKTPVIYPPDEEFPIGGSKVVRRSENDQVSVVAAGVTLHEALKAYEILKTEGIAIRVVDAYSVKPIDRTTLHRAARETGGKLVVVEDHWPEGGLGDAVLSALADAGLDHPRVVKLGVSGMPGSGEPAELLNAAGIDAPHIVEAVKRLLQS